MTQDANQLSPHAVHEMLKASGHALRAQVSALKPEAAAWHPAPGEWCAKEVLGHIIEAERRGFNGRIRQILAGQPIANWDQEAVARERNDCARRTPDLVNEFVRLRVDSAALVFGLRDEDLDKAAEHPKVGRLTIRDLLHEWVHHDGNHHRQLLANLQAYVWPSMGNAQKFSG